MASEADWESEDSEGEDLSTIRPTLIRELKNILDLYPDDGQILKELIQNAEDARAKEVIVVTDRRRFNQDFDSHLLKKYPHLKFLRGPALCVYNDAEFTKEDWQGIRMLHTSIKEEDPLKVGRFGLGFKSVFHLTDRLLILSGNFIMYMDPFKGENHYCNLHSVAGRKGRELQSLLQCLDGILGVSRDTFREITGHFKGTLFWFPLRQSASELSETVYTEERVDNLLGSFRAEASSLLLFLTSVQHVKVMDIAPHNNVPEKVFKVGLTKSCVQDVDRKRESFLSAITANHPALPHIEASCITYIAMEMKDYTRQEEQEGEWLVVHFHSGQQEMSRSLSALCSNAQLSYRPRVGVAVPLTNRQQFQSQVFCFLPLPLDTRSPTGLPVHVHGYLALEQNRRHVKWPSADRRSAQDPQCQWNALLLTEVLPRAYILAIDSLQTLHQDDPEAFYWVWPDITAVSDRWHPLVGPVYQSLASQPVFYSKFDGGQWVHLHNSVLLKFPHYFNSDVQETIMKIYTQCRKTLVELPESVCKALQHFQLLGSMKRITAEDASQLLPTVLSSLTRSEKMNVMQYLAVEKVSLLTGFQLLPLANGRFGVFKQQQRKSSSTFLCSSVMLRLFPGLEDKFCDVNVPDNVTKTLQQIAHSGYLSVELLNEPKSDIIPSLLQQSIVVKYPNQEVAIDNDWLKHVWHFLTKNKISLAKFLSLPLLPQKNTQRSPRFVENGNYILLPITGLYITDKYPGLTSLPEALQSALTKLGVTVLPSLPDYVIEHREVMSYVQFPNDEGIINVLTQVNRSKAIQSFNLGASAEEKTAIVEFICKASNISAIKPLMSCLAVFTSTKGNPASVETVPYLAPDQRPPLMTQLLLHCAGKEKKAAVILGAKEMSVNELVSNVLKEIRNQDSNYPKDKITEFMLFVLNSKELLKDGNILELTKSSVFVQTRSGKFHKPEDLYDPTSSMLLQLFQFHQDTLFPYGNWTQPDLVKKLQRLGLRGLDRAKEEDIVSAALSAQNMWNANKQKLALEIAQSLWAYLLRYGSNVTKPTLQSLAKVQCLPCLQEKPSNYPPSLPLKSTTLLVKPVEMASNELLPLVGSSVSISKPGLTQDVMHNLSIMISPDIDYVLKHLQNLTKNYQRKEKLSYIFQTLSIFEFFSENVNSGRVTSRLQEIECILTESEETFKFPHQMCLERGEIDLRPYRFIPSTQYSDKMRELMLNCGSARSQDSTLLHIVLGEIQNKYQGRTSAHTDYKTDLKLVKHILEKLNEDGQKQVGTTLLPIICKISGVLTFKNAEDCTLSPLGGIHALGAMNETYHFVLPDIEPAVAEGLGALRMATRAWTGVEEFEYDDYEQHEDLTSRLHGLLHEAYTDGFSVPKELVQNADDASATKICFLLDERENLDAKVTLLDQNMASLQGPAIWAYNDATFSDTDFRNIVHLGAGTKKDDVSKIGRFGLGFNAVYNLTEVPCFLSRHWMAMFDPQRKYINSKGGIKLDFRKPVNKDLLIKFSDQFKPFKGIFGCRLQSDAHSEYSGTLFRFPLRTPEQASNSLLKMESYTSGKQQEFLKMLLDRAGSLLMFTQSVKEIHVYHLSKNSKDPAAMKLLLSVKKRHDSPLVLPLQVELGNKTIMQHFKEKWGKTNTDVRLSHKISIRHTVTKDAKAVCGLEQSDCEARWQLAWASGVNRSAKMALKYQRQEGLVPVAAVAVLLSDEGLKALSEGPLGFYKKGHLFCFLPLPEETANNELPIHINAMFALTSDRRGLLMQTEDDFQIRGSDWNAALYDDAICRAYFLLLEIIRPLAKKNDGFQNYFSLWPSNNCITALVTSFYQKLQSDDNAVIPVHGGMSDSGEKWVSFKNACFLDPAFRVSDCGKLAWEAIQRFWREDSVYFVDVPSDICSLMQKYCGKSFTARMITELEFYTKYFFPNLTDVWWQKEKRDRLVLRALMHKAKDIQELVKQNACIPCQSNSKLKKPDQLVSPQEKIAELFLLEEGYFPQSTGLKNKKKKKKEKVSQATIDFCEHNTLQRLATLGMITNVLPWKMLEERAESVGQLNRSGKREEAVKRSSRVILYLAEISEKLKECPNAVRESLSQKAFLPVLEKPSDWPFKWAGDASKSCFEAPSELSSEKMKNLVSCCVKLLDRKALELKGASGLLTGKPRHVLKWLGVTVEEDYSSTEQLQHAINQLITIAQYYNSHLNSKCKEMVQHISSDVYTFLSTCLRHTDAAEAIIHSNLSDKEIVWSDIGFINPHKVAFCCHDFKCSPYLIELERQFQTQKAFFKSIGVRETFTVTDVTVVLTNLYINNDSVSLDEETLDLVSRLAQMLNKIMTLEQIEITDTSQLYLPDRHGIMQPVDCLCVDDCPTLTESDLMKFVNDKIPLITAKHLGVKSKLYQDFDTMTELIEHESFGQSEKLTDRIKRLLEGYTFDTSLFMELFQNADDAGATECKLIMDFRQLGTSTVPVNFEKLQGPALCFYNNKSFSSADMLGIQRLGVGSKSHDALKIGQYGVGFNAVFHLTDVPSFWTKENNENDVICVLDPSCQYVRNTQPNKPGIKFINIERLRHQYPDFWAGYLSDVIDMSQPGTLFRFPLRTSDMAMRSLIKSHDKGVVSDSIIHNLLEAFQEEISSSLLFVNNLEKAGIYAVTADGKLKQEFEVTKDMDSKSKEEYTNFKLSLKKSQSISRANQEGVNAIGPFEAVLKLSLQSTNSTKEDWLTIHKLGFNSSLMLPEKLLTEWQNERFNLLPRGGLAIKLPSTNNKSPESSEHQVFCMLPLPVNTKLPFHVNGHFVLDHETRRNLWESNNVKDDIKSEWNEMIALHVIVPTFIRALLIIKDTIFSAHCTQPADELAFKLKWYNQLFPQPAQTPNDFWKQMVCHIYRSLAVEDLHVFPVVHVDSHTLEWASVVSSGAFAGYFSNLKTFFEEEIKTEQPKPVMLTSGFTSSTSGRATQNKPTALEKAVEMQTLLKKLNMKVLEVPFYLYSSFQESGVCDVQEVTPKTVLTFLQSANQIISGRCNLTDLPKPVTETSLMSVENLIKLINFVSKDLDFLKTLDGLPLCLRQSKNVYMFSSEILEKPIISKFSHLLPESDEDFLHAALLKFFPDFEKVLHVLRPLTIPLLAERLHCSLKEPCLMAGKMCLVGLEYFPHKDWIKSFWEFIGRQLAVNKNKEKSQQADGVFKSQPDKMKLETAELRHTAEKVLHVLSMWSLIPVKTKNRTMLRLFPIRHMHHVLHLSHLKDESNGRLWEILQKLPLPALDTLQLPIDNIASKLVASISHPKALLNALMCCTEKMTASHEEASVVLSYFSNGLTILKETCDDSDQLKRELRSLPVFPAIDGSLVSVTHSVPILCVESSIPENSLMSWSKLRQPPVLVLRSEFIPKDLMQFLGFNMLSNADFYSRYVLCTIDALALDSIVTHMEFLLQNFFTNIHDLKNLPEEKKKLQQQLMCTAFINLNGIYHKASDFYDPHNSLFKVMCGTESFPPKPYSDPDWSGLMEAAGIVKKITDKMLLDFAGQIEREGKEVIKNGKIPDKLIQQSKILVQHLFSQENISTFLLTQIRSVQFVLPLDWSTIPEIEYLMQIAKPFSTPDRLVSYNECCLKDNLHLVWSSSCLLHSSADPRKAAYCHTKKVVNMIMQHLGQQETAPKDRVMKHAKNICLHLGGYDEKDLFKALKKDHQQLIDIMEKLYRYFEDNFKSEQDLAALKDLKIICDVDNCQMLQPCNVVIDLRDYEMIRKFIQKAPNEFGRHFNFFKKLGVHQQVTADHYARVLFILKGQAGNQALHVEEFKIVKTAVQGMFRCLKDGTSEQKNITINELYLPCKDKSLQMSTTIVFKDEQFLGKRSKSAPPGMHFMLSLSRLEITPPITVEDIKLLPMKHKVILLSEVVQEIIPDEIKRTAKVVNQSNRLAAKLAHPSVCHAIVRLVHDMCKTSCLEVNVEENARKVLASLKLISVMKVSQLYTVVKMLDKIVADSEWPCSCFLECVHSGGVRSATVYVNSDALKNWHSNEDQFLEQLVYAIKFVTDMHLDKLLLDRVLRNPARAQGLLDEKRIAQFDVSGILEKSVFYKPGSFVPLDQHCYLQNNFDDFYIGEHVGYEVYDQADTESVTEDNNPVYIYGIIIEELFPEGDEHVGRLNRIYIVDLGPNKEKIKISVLQLYKLVRKPITDALTKKEKKDDRDSIHDVPPEFKTVLREIRSLLSEAWTDRFNKAERRRVVKRLLLHWHPDKNLHNKEFCTRVTQAIFHYVSLLDQGRPLPDDDDDEYKDKTDSYDFFRRSGSTFDPSFFRNMNARGCRHGKYESEHRSRKCGRRSRSGWGASGSSFYYPNVQPGEGQRWLQQSVADLAVAVKAMETRERGLNWICYLFHQAAEKALKAVLYNRDSDNVDTDCHDLAFLATRVAHETLQDLAADLERLLGPQDRMQYPDVLAYPRIPDEVFTDADVAKACDNSSKIVATVQNII